MYVVHVIDGKRKSGLIRNEIYTRLRKKVECIYCEQ